MKELILYPNEEEKINIEFDIVYPEKKLLTSKSENTDINENLYDLNIKIDEISELEFNNGLSEFEKTNYTIAAVSGMFTGILNILWSKDYELENAQKWGKEKVEKFVCNVAKNQGCKSDNIQDSIRFLENKYPIQADKYTNTFGGGLQHHLRDFSHHPTIFGLISSILNQFGIGIGTDVNGNFIVDSVSDNQFIGHTFGEKIYNAFIMWSFHLISDMAGSSSSLSGGTGIPGIILSTFKEMSSLPIFKEIKVKYKDDDIGLSLFISKLFNGSIFKDENGKPIKLDFRTELGLVANQSKSVVINECLVRGIYTIRSLYRELSTKDIKTISDLKRIDFKEVLPFKSRILTRMLTISSGIFVLLDLSKATVKSIGKNLTTFLLNINYVGIGRFILSCRADAGYIEEDVRKAVYEKYFGNDTPIFDFKMFDLNIEQSQVIYSLQLEKIKYDILYIKNEEEKEEKIAWCNQWKKNVLNKLNKSDKFFITDGEELYNKLNTIFKNDDKFYFIVLELYLFKPYYKFSKDDKGIKKYKLSSDYFKDLFKIRQKCLSINTIDNIIKTYKNYNKNVLQNKTKKLIIGASATTTITLITGGLGWIFAPQIAIALAGESVAGLSGAALTSASLAFVGGGSLAAGGLGMAGGTAILTGGGALIGLASSSATTIATVLNSDSSINILDECSKLLTFCKLILADKLKDYTGIKTIKVNIDEAIKKIESFNADKDKKKVIKTNIKYLTRCSKALKDIIDNNTK